MTDKKMDSSTDRNSDLNHFDQTGETESSTESSYTADLLVDAEHAEQMPEEKKEESFDSTWNTDRFVEYDYGKKEPIIPQQPDPESQDEDAITASEVDQQPADSDVILPFNTSEQVPPIAENTPSSPADEQHRSTKSITVFAILAMLVAAIAVWLNTGPKESQNTLHNQAIKPIQGQDSRIGHLESRLSELEQQSNRQNTTLKQQLDHLEQQVSTLTRSLTKKLKKQEFPRHVKKVSHPTRVKPAKTPASSRGSAGWVINLASVDSQHAANKALARYKSQRIPAEIFSVNIKGKTWYRLRITGFSSQEKATTQKKILTDKFSMRSIWVQKP